MSSSLTSRPPGTLARVGALCSRNAWAVVLAWVIALLALVFANRLGGGTFSDNVNLSGTQANTGAQLLTANVPTASANTGTVTFDVTSGSLAAHQSAIETSVQQLAKLPHVLSASDPFSGSPPTVSQNGRIAYSTVQFDARPKTFGSGYVDQLDAATSSSRSAGVRINYGGALDDLVRPTANDLRSEGIGFAVALIVLLVGFGSVLAAVLPLLTALIGTVVALSMLGLVAGVLSFGTAAPTLATMIGLGVGIDYALFLATRFRQLIADGVAPDRAAGRVVATSGHAVLVAAGTVAVALLGLYASDVIFLGQLGFAAVFGVAVAALAAITLVPAGLGLLGRRIDSITVRRPVAETGSPDDWWHRYARTVTRHHWWFFGLGLVILAVLSIPLLHIRLGHVDDGADPTSFTDKRAYDLIKTGFGPGANGPFTLVVDLKGASASPNDIANSLQHAVAAVPGVAHVGPLNPSPNGVVLVGQVVPTTGPQDATTSGLFNTLIDKTVPDALQGTGAKGYVTGTTATQLQFKDTMASKLPLIIGIVVLVAFLLILSAFRSLLLAAKAAVLNLMSIGAAYGVVVAVFQWGWGRSLFGVSENVPVESYVPLLMFAIIFGLSMDYEVFLLSRVKESFDRSGENLEAVREGLASTGRVITCAALIMISVFSSFTASHLVVIKMIALGLAMSVLIDASVVRLLLVPATMTLFPKATWWMPRWLDRVLPRIDAEGHDDEPVEPVGVEEPISPPAPLGPTPAM
ncbi:MAG TPA: MMPL family transporter [Jatrophihabitans sp.]|nr:MMPL family transporter [Jatrophihabitans sp.]